MKALLKISALLYIFFVIPVAEATSLRPISLEQLSTRATLIFYGEVISNEVKRDTASGLIATFTQFKVLDLIKGNAEQTHTIKQLGGHMKGSNLRLKIHGVPEFIPGNDYVVFLPEKSELGFSSPLGLHQGLFNVQTLDGKKIIRNANKLSPSNATVKRSISVPLAVDTQNSGQSSLADFTNTVRAYTLE